LATFIYKNIEVHYTTNGKGSAVVLLHGFLENRTMWNNIMPIMAKKNRVVAIDLLGHGKTENLSYVHTMEEQAEMVKSVLNHLKLRRYTLIGHSLGGYISLAFAELFSKNTKKICLMNSTALPDSKEKQRNRDRAVAMVKKNCNTFIKIAIPNLFTAESKVIHKKAIQIIKEQALLTSKQGVIASLEGMKIRKNRTEILKNNLFQKLFIIGKKDPLLAYNDLIKQVENTNVKVVEFSNGHMSHVENERELIAELLQFVKD